MTILESFKNGEFAITDSTWDLVDYLHDNDNCLYEEYMVDTTLTHVSVGGECIKSVMYGENSAELPTMTAKMFLQFVKGEEEKQNLSPVKIRILNGGSSCYKKGDIIFLTNDGTLADAKDEESWFYTSADVDSLLEKFDNYYCFSDIEYEVVENSSVTSKPLVTQLSKNDSSISIDFESGIVYEIFEVKKENLSDLIELLQEAEKEFEING